MNVIEKPVGWFVEYGKNPRKNDHAVDRVATAISQFGFRVPMMAKSDGSVIDGHLRLKAAKQIGLANIPVIISDDMTDNEIKAFRISVNKMATLASWDADLLADELKQLNALDFDMSLVGFEEFEMQGFLSDNESSGSAMFPQIGNQQNSDQADDGQDPPKKPSKVDNEYVEFALVMRVENKAALMAVLSELRDSKGHTQDQALMYIIEGYKKHNDENS